MLLSHATFKDGGYNFVSGLAEMEQRFASSRLLVAKHLTEWFDEYRGYHRVNNLVHKVDDDLMSATRVLCMQIRSAKALHPYRPGTGPLARRQEAFEHAIPRRALTHETEDVFGGGPGFDVFTGQYRPYDVAARYLCRRARTARSGVVHRAWRQPTPPPVIRSHGGGAV
jgi:hypothetical protein